MWIKWGRRIICSLIQFKNALSSEIFRTSQLKKKSFSWSVVIFMDISAQRGKAPSNVNRLHPTQTTSSTSRCPLLPVSLSGPWQTLWSGLLSAARMFVCSLSHLVAWRTAQCASSLSMYPAWRREIKQKKQKKNCHEDYSLRRGSHHWRNLSALPLGEETVRHLDVTQKVAMSLIFLS